MIYEIKTELFELKDVFECGQCFRWNQEENGSYTGVFRRLCTKCGKNSEENNF